MQVYHAKLISKYQKTFSSTPRKTNTAASWKFKRKIEGDTFSHGLVFHCHSNFRGGILGERSFYPQHPSLQKPRQREGFLPVTTAKNPYGEVQFDQFGWEALEIAGNAVKYYHDQYVFYFLFFLLGRDF